MGRFVSIYTPLMMATVNIYLSMFYYIFLVMVFVGIADIRSRYKDYNKFKSKEYGLEKTCRRLRGSFCQRMVAVAIYGKDACKYYSDLGYKSWHIFPEKTFTLNSPFLNINCYREIFLGTRTDRMKK